MKDFVKIETAVISIHDKTGIKYFASELVKVNPEIKIISSGGTFAELNKVVPDNIIDVSEYTGFPEMPGGLVKTLHPKVHGGILGNEAQEEYMEKHGIRKIDLVVVNLYPFRKGAAISFEEARKNIDIGGVSLIEAGCKNFSRVSVCSDPAEYEIFLESLRRNNGTVELVTRLKLAKLGLSLLSSYLSAISSYFDRLTMEGLKEIEDAR